VSIAPLASCFGAILLLVSFGFGQSISYLHCPSIGRDLDSANSSAYLVWTDFFFDLDQHPRNGYGIIEGGGSVGKEFGKCLSVEEKCLLMRVALPIEEICSGIVYPKIVKVRTHFDWSQLDWNNVGFENSSSPPIDITFNYRQSRNPVVVSSNGERSHRLKHLSGILRFSPTPRCHENSDLKFGHQFGEFISDSFSELGKRNIFRQIPFDIVYPRSKFKVEISELISLRQFEMETGGIASTDAPTILDDENLLCVRCKSARCVLGFVGSSGEACFTVGEKYYSTFANHGYDCCGTGDADESNQNRYSQNDCGSRNR